MSLQKNWTFISIFSLVIIFFVAILQGSVVSGCVTRRMANKQKYLNFQECNEQRNISWNIDQIFLIIGKLFSTVLSYLGVFILKPVPFSKVNSCVGQWFIQPFNTHLKDSFFESVRILKFCFFFNYRHPVLYSSIFSKLTFKMMHSNDFLEVKLYVECVLN